jgi:sec-independent protein translocase protein TatA
MGRFGMTEILILLVLAVVLFGGSRIAGIGKGLGDGIRNFKKGLKDDEEDEESPKLREAEKGSFEKVSEKPVEKGASGKS